VLDGDYQTFKANDGAYVRKHFFGKYPEPLKLVEHMSDDDIWSCAAAATTRKVYAAFHAANEHKGQPTVLLVKTVKGYGMGKAGEGKNTVHQTKKLATRTSSTSATASTSRSPTASWPASRTTSRPTTRRR
jgi:pyruvate dehydrogenase E1 component